MPKKATIKTAAPTLYSIGHGNRDSETLRIAKAEMIVLRFKRFQPLQRFQLLQQRRSPDKKIILILSADRGLGQEI